MSAPGRKRCIVAYAMPDEQLMWTVELTEEGTVADAVAAACAIANREDVPWQSTDLGIFGQLCTPADVPADGDRIEIYRSLTSDPRERRRERVRKERRALKR